MLNLLLDLLFALYAVGHPHPTENVRDPLISQKALTALSQVNLHLGNISDLLKPGHRQGRWGVFFSYEPICTRACVNNGKYGGRMFGGVCRCYCVRNEQAPCQGSYPSCDRLCQLNFYPLGGDCLDGKSCFCTCSVRQPQTPNGTLPTTTLAPCLNSSISPPFSGPSIQAPSPGTLGIQGQGVNLHRDDDGFDFPHG